MRSHSLISAIPFIVIQVVSGIIDQVNYYFEVDNWPIDIEIEIDIEI